MMVMMVMMVLIIILSLFFTFESGPVLTPRRTICHFLAIFVSLSGLGDQGSCPTPKKNVSLPLPTSVGRLFAMRLSFAYHGFVICLSVFCCLFGNWFCHDPFFGLFLSETGLPPKFAKLETQTTKMTSQISRACGNPIL